VNAKSAGVLCAVALSWATATTAATVTDWRADTDELARDLQAIHPDPFARCGKLTFLRHLDAFKNALSTMSEEQRMVGAMRLVAMVGDTHTQLEPNRPDFASWFPLRLYQFTDGYHVTAAHESVSELAGAQVLEVAGKPVEQAVNDARSLMGADNAFASREYVFALSDSALMKGLGYADAEGRMRVKFRLANGRVNEKILLPHRTDDPRFDKDDSSFEWHFQAEMGGPPFGTPAQWISAYKQLPYESFRTTDLSRPFRLMNRRFFAARYLPAQDAFYIQSNFVGDDFDRQFRDALADVDKDKPRRLIVDLRYNFGGDGSHVPAMAREFIKREDHRLAGTLCHHRPPYAQRRDHGRRCHHEQYRAHHHRRTHVGADQQFRRSDNPEFPEDRHEIVGVDGAPPAWRRQGDIRSPAGGHSRGNVFRRLCGGHGSGRRSNSARR
jgi:hypothetical protein